MSESRSVAVEAREGLALAVFATFAAAARAQLRHRPLGTRFPKVTMRTILAILFMVLATADLASAQVNSSGARHLQLLAEVGPDSSSAVTLTGSCGTFQFLPTPVLTLEHVAEVVIEQHGLGEGYFVVLRLTKEGSERLQRETEQLIGRRLGVVYSGQLKVAPFVQITLSKRFPLNGVPMPLSEAEEVATDLNTRIGALDPHWRDDA